jgi:hypothetical protein
MKKIIYLFLLFFLFGCNISDYREQLPNKYEFWFEGGSNNRLAQGNMNEGYELVIDSGVVDCSYNDDYLLVSIDTTYSMYPEKVEKSKLQYLIQDLKKDSILRDISYEDLKKLISEKSLQKIDISK